MTMVQVVITWSLWTVAVSVLAHLLPTSAFDHDGPITRLREWERNGGRYEPLGVRRWKAHLPDAATLFPGGLDKRHLAVRDPEALRRLETETRRAEVAHWASLAIVPCCAVWSPAPTVVALATIAVIANGPCIVAQRYNRARLHHVLERAATRHPG
ncbi:MAG: hypothetical protein ACRDZ2_16940 [Ilumatobacteraceae bacterium]